MFKDLELSGIRGTGGQGGGGRVISFFAYNSSGGGVDLAETLGRGVRFLSGKKRLFERMPAGLALKLPMSG